MLEGLIRDFLIEELNEQNIFVGEAPSGTTAETLALVLSSNSPLTDSHNSLAERLRTPKGIGETSVAIAIIVKSNDYNNASSLIFDIYNALGGDDGGCITHNGKQMYIIPDEAPFCIFHQTQPSQSAIALSDAENTFKLNFIVRTQK